MIFFAFTMDEIYHVNEVACGEKTFFKHLSTHCFKLSPRPSLIMFPLTALTNTVDCFSSDKSSVHNLLGMQ